MQPHQSPLKRFVKERIPHQWQKYLFRLLLIPARRRNRRQNFRMVFVLTERRTGSNLLLSCLNSHQDVMIFGELLNKNVYCGVLPGEQGQRAMAHLDRSLRANSHRVTGAKIFLSNLTELNLTVADLLQAYPAARFIHLRRRDQLRQFVSHRLARATGQFVREGRNQEFKKLTIPASEYADYRRKLATDERQLSVLAPDQLLSLTYEELQADPTAVIRTRVLPFIGVPDQNLATRLRKQMTKDLSDVVVNLAELEAIDRQPV